MIEEEEVCRKAPKCMVSAEQQETTATLTLSKVSINARSARLFPLSSGSR